MLKVCIAGSRDFTDYATLKEFCRQYLYDNYHKLQPSDVTIISGGARGVDQMGERFAKDFGCNLHICRADWDEYGKSAGYRRNVDMAEIADLAIIFWDDVSKGTGHMIKICNKERVKTILFHTQQSI
jgi:hypothetical protein